MEAPFWQRHLGTAPAERERMAQEIGYDSVEALLGDVIPADLPRNFAIDLGEPVSEQSALDELARHFSGNRVLRSYYGMGYYGTHTPAPLRRHILENPGWYTAYTPYQPEISQGRLEMLFHFQSMICDLTGLEVANASLLDEATAAAEAMALAQSVHPQRHEFLVASHTHPQTLAVLRTRAAGLGVALVVADLDELEPNENTCGILLQYPATDGALFELDDSIASAHAAGALAIVATDVLALTVLRSPGAMEADIAVGSTQRFGVPMGFGGPHAAFLAARDKYVRQLPGRLVGLSRDVAGQPAYRLSLQTREQHIRREKARSNICTAQVLLAVMAAGYAIYHGPEGLQRIARRIHGQASWLAKVLEKNGYALRHQHFFDTLAIATGDRLADSFLDAGLEKGILLRALDEHTIAIAFDETVSMENIAALLELFLSSEQIAALSFPSEEEWKSWSELPDVIRRSGAILDYPVFHRYRSETELMRYLARLQAKDLSLVHSMIALGSCTMKLNAASELEPLHWEGVSGLHPYAPLETAPGYQKLFADLESGLGQITGLPSVSLQPNAGSQGEYAGLLAIAAYHAHHGGGARNICLIPTSAHGTNPASAVMAGFRVVPVACDGRGDIDASDLASKIEAHREVLGALMLTYPSTHGVFEESVVHLTAQIHAAGGLVYLDGANMNALAGLVRPADLGADVCHLNLHKTFCIPHGGGGPGVGPICATEALAPFLPGNPLIAPHARTANAVSAAPWGSASILPISWIYLRLMGAKGLAQASETAIVHANWIAHRLASHYPILYTGRHGRVAHECIVDLRTWKGVVEVEDVAKRLIDYGFHAPTMAWPVAGTLMIEPTESESLEEIERFCEAMISIRSEIEEVVLGKINAQDNPLKNAPHTALAITSADWSHPYSREVAAFPAPWTREHKYWPPVGRVDQVYGDRHLVCSCVGMEEYR